ncbi:MAG: hypothetical protein JW854_12250 [Actinobacteria bacterium]|nr:hypothetical protein [Actinomycetota bacterium]
MKTGSYERKAAEVPPVGDTRERLVVKDAEGLHVLGRFMRAMILNLLKDPDKVRMLARLDLVVAIEPPAHPDNALSVGLSNGRVVLQSGVVDPDIRLICEAAVLMKLARVPAGPAAVKFMRTHEGKDLIASMRSGDLRIKGVFRHPLGMMGFAKFLAPVEGLRS